MNLLSERLRKAIADEEARRGVTIKNADLARAAKTSQTSVGFWLSGTNGIGAAKARLLGEYLHVDPYWLETGSGRLDSNTTLPVYRDLKMPSRVRTYDPEDDIPDDVVLVPESRIEFAAGNGRTPMYELVEEEEPATYRRTWFQKRGINPDHVRRFRVSGDSMEPMLYARDTILVNEDERNVVDGKLYAIRYGDELRVKYLSRRLDGTLLLRSVNPAYAIEEVAPELVEQHISVIGRVRDKSGTGGL
jgi:phage repressor protein C with HTH and peptisase S24 domain